MPVELQAGAQHGGQRHGLGQQRRDRRRIVVAVQDIVHHRPEPHDPPADAQRLDLEGQDQIIAAIGVQAQAMEQNALLDVQAVFRFVEDQRVAVRP